MTSQDKKQEVSDVKINTTSKYLKQKTVYELANTGKIEDLDKEVSRYLAMGYVPDGPIQTIVLKSTYGDMFSRICQTMYLPNPDYIEKSVVISKTDNKSSVKYNEMILQALVVSYLPTTFASINNKINAYLEQGYERVGELQTVNTEFDGTKSQTLTATVRKAIE